MERLEDLWTSVQGWLATLPPPQDPDFVVVIATLVGGLGLAALTNGWVEHRVSKSGLFATLVGALLLVWVWAGQGSFSLTIIPESFIEIIARIIR